MTQTTDTARADLAFLRAVAEDRGPLPRIMGEHFLIIGLLYGLNILVAYAGKIGLIPWPENDAWWAWLPAAVIHVIYSIAFSWRTRGYTPGPALKAFAGAWFAMVAMTAAIVGSIYVAQAQTGIAYDSLWPPIAFALYGGAWTMIGVTRKNLGNLFVALGCFATAVLCSALVDRPEKFLVLGLGVIGFLGGPGAAIMFTARRT